MTLSFRKIIPSSSNFLSFPRCRCTSSTCRCRL